MLEIVGVLTITKIRGKESYCGLFWFKRNEEGFYQDWGIREIMTNEEEEFRPPPRGV